MGVEGQELIFMSSGSFVEDLLNQASGKVCGHMP